MTDALPALPTSFSESDLGAAGFEGWTTWDELRQDEFEAVPSSPIAYVVFRKELTEPSFLKLNPGGRFKGRDPTVSLETLEHEWVAGAHVIYIGKAEVGDRRLTEFARFGAGGSIGHWGGV